MTMFAQKTKEEWEDHYRQMAEEEKTKRKTTWVELKPQLLQVGVDEVEMEYDGSGDEGDCQEIRFLSAETETTEHGNEREAIAVSEVLSGQVVELLLNVLDAAFGSWEIDDGAHGQITLDVVTGHVKINHWVRVMGETDEMANVNLENAGEDNE